MKYKYKISVIIPVYNAEEYLKETIESILNQTMIFKDNIQMVLINDGSIDKSDKICNKYKNKYPENIVYINKKNEGVSVTRNLGMKYAEGKYINFLDSDDMWDKTAFENAYNMLEKNSDVDMVSCRVKFFDLKNGYHVLDYRFEEGTRIVDINEEEDCIQTFIGTVFFRAESIMKHRFDTNLKYAEDVKFVNDLLLLKSKYGLISNSIYYYRKRQDNSSATQQGASNAEYFAGLKASYLYIVNKSIEKFGKVKRYFQSLVMYELQWRIKKEISRSILSLEEENEYLDIFEKLLCYIDDDIILKQRTLKREYKIFLLQIKYKNKFKNLLSFKEEKVYISNTLMLDYDKINNFISMSKVESGHLIIDGRVFLLDKVDFYYTINNNEHIKIEPYGIKEIKLKNVFKNRYKITNSLYKLDIDLDDIKDIVFEVKIGNKYYEINSKYRNYSRINNYKVGYYYNEKYLITKKKRHLKIKYKPFKLRLICNELKFLAYLFFKKKKLKVVIQRMLYWITRPFIPKNIWIFSDREFMARDSGEALFRYAMKYEKENKGNYYFVIGKDYEDFKRMKQYGKVIRYHSMKYKLLFLNARYIISSHADAYVNNAFGKARKYYVDLYKLEYIYLTHGILLHDSSDWLNRLNTNIVLNVVTSPLEYESIIEGNYYFEPKQLMKTGLPRHDNLFKDEKEQNKILIMASWRSLLAGPIIKGTQRRLYNPGFINSEYCNFYNTLFEDERLQKTLKEYDYKIKFCVHPSFREQFRDFKGNDRVEISIDVDSQYETRTSKLLITDYSSAACDFAYLRKPVIYANFDYDHIYDIHYYNKGYFDYDINGFGPNCRTYVETIDEIINAIHHDCNIQEKYEKRCDEFFYYNDANNSRRVYDTIIKHDNERKQKSEQK